MKGLRSSVTTLPENLSFDHGSTSSDGGIDSQVPWPSMQTSADNRLPDYRVSPSETNCPYGELNGEWSLGESSSQSQADHSERKREHARSIHSLPVLEHQPEPSNILSLDSIDVDGHGNHIANRSSILQISGSNALPQDLNMCSEFRDSEDIESQVVENLNEQISVRSSNEKMPSSGIENSDCRPGCSLDGRRISCKRKALEVHAGQSSGAGSSNCFERAERSQWHGQNNTSDVSMSTQAEHNLDFGNGSEQSSSGIRLGVGGTVSPNLFSSSVRGPVESTGRNFRLRINASHQQDHASNIPFSTEPNVGNSDVSSSRHSSRLLLRNRLFNLDSTPPSENRSHLSQSALSVPSLRRNPQSRWRGTSSSRTTNASASAISLEREGDAMPYEEFTPGSIPSSISEHPMFVSASEIGSSSQQPTNWNSAAGIVASTSRTGSASGVNSSSPAWAHRSYPQYPRRLSEIVRRSLLSSVGTEPGGQSSNLTVRSSSSGSPQELALPTSSGSGSHVHHISNSRSAALLERHLDGAPGIPYPLRSLGAAGEGRSSIMSEQIRHVLDLMRRGEGLRIEDMMLLDHSVLFGMADVFDRHRDMRMDVDNMSYEELLALEEQIGTVCTGLSEETIRSRLKERKYPKRTRRNEADAETEPCSICREEYNNGDDLGILECGHDFHRECIKEWLLHKNLCPICKTTGLSK